MADLLLDTGAMIRLANRSPMRAEALAAIAQARVNAEIIAVSPMSAWEIAAKVAGKRLSLAMAPHAYFRAFLDAPGVTLAAMPPELLIESWFLPGEPPPDPADRIIVATAREYGLTVVTRNETLLAYAADGHVNALAC